MKEFVYYALRCLSQNAKEKADELGVNPTAYNYKSMSDPRREGQYLFVTIDAADGYVLSTDFIKSFSELDDVEPIDITVIN